MIWGIKLEGVWQPLLGGGVAFILLIGTVGLAQGGREFAGFYDLSSASASGDTYLITLDIQVFNYGAADVNYGTINLKGPLPPREVYGTYPTVFLPAGGSVRLTGDFTIPARLYQEWQKGIPPHLSLKYQATDGKTYLRSIELTPMLLAEEE